MVITLKKCPANRANKSQWELRGLQQKAIAMTFWCKKGGIRKGFKKTCAAKIYTGTALSRS